MILRGVVVSKTITANGVFARIRIKGLPKNGSMRFFDVPDEMNFEIGQKIEIGIIPAFLSQQEPLSWDLETAGTYEEKVPGCMFHSAPGPADIVSATGVTSDPLPPGYRRVVIGSEIDPNEVRTLDVPGCESPASVFAEENHRGGTICLDEQGHEEL